MKVGDLVNDKRNRTSTKYGKAGIVTAVIGDIVQVLWPTAPTFPLWASEDDLEVISESR
jgi:hypothetical protein